MTNPFPTVADRNPCPVCLKAPQSLPGILVPGGDIKERYFVCWGDNIAKKRPNGEWKLMRERSEAKVHWKKHTPYHWSRQVAGEHLDYWPSKKKWRYLDENHTGDVNAFIRTVEGT